MSCCPNCKSKGEATEVNSMNQYVCLNCGALLTLTPFRIELVMKDVRKRFPELAALPVKKWNKAEAKETT